MQGATRDDVYDYALKNYNTTPEHLWTTFPLYAVFRRVDNKKWYAIIMDVQKNKLGINSEERVDIMDIKCEPARRDMLLKQKGFLPAYHLNRENWITVLLDGSVDKETVFGLLDESYLATNGKPKKARRYK